MVCITQKKNRFAQNQIQQKLRRKNGQRPKLEAQIVLRTNSDGDCVARF
jgi:hypothetical protein